MAGGICGIHGYGLIQNCYNVATINGGSSENGGIVGLNYNYNTNIAEVNSCYNMGYISNGSAIAGVNGTSNFNGWKGNGKITDCYYLSNGLNGVGKTISGATSTTYARTQDQMPTVLSVINSDNAFVEDTEGINGGYPLLAWQVKTTE